MDRSENTFIFLGKRKMIELMKEQFEYFTDKDAKQNYFHYDKYGKSERLTYLDDYDNVHDIYHSIVGGEEMCLYHENNDRNRRVNLPSFRLLKATNGGHSKSVISSLKEYRKEIAAQPKANNLEHQRSDQER